MKQLACLAMIALGVVSCGKAPEESAVEESRPAAESFDKESGTASSGPAISPTAAPGVAFNYAYRFRLPGIRIAQVQEEHAQACEKLGIARCRITGMRYRVLGENRIEAMLAFKLAPEIARAFGKEGVTAIQRAEGMVVDTSISGTDVSDAISSARRNEQEIKEQIAQLEGELAKGGLKSDARQDLIDRLDALRSARRQNVDTRTDNEAALANTPMVFTYGSGGLIPGFDAQSPIIDALQTAGRVLVGILAFLIIALAIVVPLALVIAVGVFLLPRLRSVYGRLARQGGTNANDGATEQSGLG